MRIYEEDRPPRTEGRNRITPRTIMAVPAMSLGSPQQPDVALSQIPTAGRTIMERIRYFMNRLYAIS